MRWKSVVRFVPNTVKVNSFILYDQYNTRNFSTELSIKVRLDGNICHKMVGMKKSLLCGMSKWLIVQ
jgi:hypothetical protein